MSSTCLFQMNKPTYFSGETVNGTIILQLISEETVQDVHIVLLNDGKVSWNESEERTRSDGTKYTDIIEFSSSEVYLEIRQVVHGAGNIPPGTYSFPFTFELPMNSKSSFEGPYGSIQYNLSLVLKRGWQNTKFDKPLKVLQTDDLNLNPTYRVPLEAEEIKTFCCTSSTIPYKVRLPYGAFVPKQKFEYAIHIENQSMSDVRGYSIVIHRLTKYVATRPQRDERNEKHEVYSKDHEKQCLRLSTRIFKGSFKFPNVTPSTQGHSIISISYEMLVTINFSGCIVDSEVKIPLHIGTIPLRESVLATAPTEQFDYDVDDNDADPPSYQDIRTPDPPTFAEATLGSAPPAEDSVMLGPAPSYESIANSLQHVPAMDFQMLNEKPAIS